MTVTEVKKNQIESLLRACRLVGRMNKNRPDGMKSEQLYYQMLDKYFTNVLNAKQENGFVAAHTVFFPVEILYAMGISPLHNEVTTWTSALLLGNQSEFLTAGAEAGLAAEICSPHRGLAGGYFRGLLPKPDAVLWSNLICDNTAKSGEYIMELDQLPRLFPGPSFRQFRNGKEIHGRRTQGHDKVPGKDLRAQNGLGQAVAKRGRDGQANQAPEPKSANSAKPSLLPFPPAAFWNF